MSRGVTRALTRTACGLGWLAAGGMTASALIRALSSETEPLLIGVQGITVWLLLPAYPLLAGTGIVLVRRARRARRRSDGPARLRWPLALGTVALALVVVQATLLIPAIGWNGPRTAPVGATPLRIVSANVLLDNTELATLAGELVATDADVIVLEEVTPEHLATLAASPLWAAYPERILDALPGYHGSAIFSRLPIEDGGPIDVAGSPMLEARIHTPAGLVRIIDVHAVAPVTSENTVLWRGQYAELARIAASDTGTLILAGDFNATLDHAPLRRLVATGLRDAFVESGRGFGATWPRWDGVVPPLMRLDHVLVSQQVTVVAVTDQTSAGSDHRRLVVDLALPSSQSPSSQSPSSQSPSSQSPSSQSPSSPETPTP
ncbi:endonuclease/exonuclease/phosphatase family protein [Cryobacterium sp. 10I1]|uniref:endonuclease/exonuclease/phosphatase family protein n=1 Tax=unclassified Cryobacterium TaxID=2649013 RepID=UPI002AC9028C|nr:MULTISPECIES: endonuclease/exonuclease/phosphatase family protein [unclassified Cryobacterium]MEB0288269.1 endonuclease/exonuclease/phosphatase family protein [Cryobacterium sp. 10S3]MEB0305816.1 endonuclease/exonuclease/phosphatase family protein [Cryobacterium sp. 10I1]WPX13219.1 endonuclease/exonuclease/phosphatase family protein [Cryobacterium sp. 10S3]